MMYVKKVYPMERSKKKANYIRKQRHHAVSTNQLIVPDVRSNSSMKFQWNHLKYGSANWMLRQLREDEYDDDSSQMDYADDDGYVSEHEVGAAADDDDITGGRADDDDDDITGGRAADDDDDITGGRAADDDDDITGGRAADDDDDITGGCAAADDEQEEEEEEEAEIIDFERDLDSEDEWTLIG